MRKSYYHYRRETRTRFADEFDPDFKETLFTAAVQVSIFGAWLTVWREGCAAMDMDRRKLIKERASQVERSISVR